MTRHASGTFRRTDRVRMAAGTTVRLLGRDRWLDCSATLVEVGLTDLLLSGAEAPPLGTKLSVSITLTGRYLEFEVPGTVTWQRGAEFGVTFSYLTLRQTYGLTLTIDLARRAADAAQAHRRTARG